MAALIGPRSRLSRSCGHFTFNLELEDFSVLAALSCPYPWCIQVPVTPTLSLSHPTLKWESLPKALGFKELVEIAVPLHVQCQRTQMLCPFGLAAGRNLALTLQLVLQRPHSFGTSIPSQFLTNVQASFAWLSFTQRPRKASMQGLQVESQPGLRSYLWRKVPLPHRSWTL